MLLLLVGVWQDAEIAQLRSQLAAAAGGGGGGAGAGGEPPAKRSARGDAEGQLTELAGKLGSLADEVINSSAGGGGGGA